MKGTNNTNSPPRLDGFLAILKRLQLVYKTNKNMVCDNENNQSYNSECNTENNKK